MVKILANCPHCQRSLMDQEHKIGGESSIALHGKLPPEAGSSEGIIHLSSIYGDFQIETSLVIPVGTVVEFSCPYCKTNLHGSRSCEECAGQMVALQLSRGGSILFCSQRGCKKHLLEFEDPEVELTAFYQEFMPYME